jgi:hypothetical protein
MKNSTLFVAMSFESPGFRQEAIAPTRIGKPNSQTRAACAVDDYSALRPTAE